MGDVFQMDLFHAGVAAAIVVEDALERQRLSAAWDRERARRRDEFEIKVARRCWLAQAQETARRRRLPAEQRRAETAERDRWALVQAQIDYAEEVDALVEDAVRIRGGKVPAAKLARYCAELRDDLDAAAWERWLRLAGLAVAADGRIKVCS